MQIGTNTKSVTVSTVVGGKPTTLTFPPNELIFDEHGIVRLVSIKFNDGTIGNFKLMPLNKTSNAAISFAQEWLLPFGLSIIGGKIMKGKSSVDGLAKWLTFSKGGGGLTDLVFDPISVSNSAYFEVTSGELVINKPIILTPAQRS